MMNLNQMGIFLTKTQDIFNNSIDKLSKFIFGLDKYNASHKITIDNFAFDNELCEEDAEIILNILCDIGIMRKIERMYRCPKCRKLVSILSIWDEGDDIICDNCNTIHPYANECDTETVYSLHEVPTLKLFTVNWLDKYEKDTNGNTLTRRAEIIAYTKSDAESLIHEYYHYVPHSIEISSGINIENKLLVTSYN